MNQPPRAARRRVPESSGGVLAQNSPSQPTRLRRGNRRRSAVGRHPVVADTVIFGTYRPERDLAGPNLAGPHLHRPRRLKRRAGKPPAYNPQRYQRVRGSSNQARTTLRLSSLMGGARLQPSAYGQPQQYGQQPAVRSVPAVRSAVSAAARPISTARPVSARTVSIEPVSPAAGRAIRGLPAAGCRRVVEAFDGGHRHRGGRPRRDHRSGRAVLGFWKPGFFVTTKLDVAKAQRGVQQILTDETNGYGAKNVRTSVQQRSRAPTVKKGATFTCEVSIGRNQASGDRDLPGRQGHPMKSNGPSSC